MLFFHVDMHMHMHRDLSSCRFGSRGLSRTRNRRCAQSEEFSWTARTVGTYHQSAHDARRNRTLKQSCSKCQKRKHASVINSGHRCDCYKRGTAMILMGSMAATGSGEMLDRGFLDRVFDSQVQRRTFLSSYPTPLTLVSGQDICSSTGRHNKLFVGFNIPKQWSPLICDLKLMQG